MNNKTDIDVKYVSPLKKICMTIGELPSSYLETMSYYEMLVWFTEFLKNQVIPTVNNNAEAVQELQVLYEELRTYVNDYFDNLDVQEEINNKLDDMLESGQLEQIIEQYIQSSALWCFDTVADMKLAENLVNGSYAKTLGYHNIKDGGQSIYKIRTRTIDDVVDEASIITLYDETLVAEFINQDNGFINVNKFGLTNNLYMNDYWSKITNYAIDNNLYIYFPQGTYKVKKTQVANDYIFTHDLISMKGDNAIIYCESSVDNATDLFKFTINETGTNKFIKGLKFDTETNDYSEVRYFLHFIFSSTKLLYNLEIENNIFMKSSNYAIYTLGNATTGGFNNCKFNNNTVYGLFIRSDNYGDSNKINGNSLFASETTQLGDYPIKLVQTAGSHSCELVGNNCSGCLGSFDSFFELLIQNNQIENVYQNLDYLINLIGGGANINIDSNNLNAHQNSDLIYTRNTNTIVQNCTLYSPKTYVINSYAHLCKYQNNRCWNGTSYLLMLTGDLVVGEVTNCLYTKTDRKYYIDNELNMHIKPLVTTSFTFTPYQAMGDNTYPYDMAVEYNSNAVQTFHFNNKDAGKTETLLHGYATFKILDF